MHVPLTNLPNTTTFSNKNSTVPLLLSLGPLSACAQPFPDKSKTQGQQLSLTTVTSTVKVRSVSHDI